MKYWPVIDLCAASHDSCSEVPSTSGLRQGVHSRSRDGQAIQYQHAETTAQQYLRASREECCMGNALRAFCLHTSVFSRQIRCRVSRKTRPMKHPLRGATTRD